VNPQLAVAFGRASFVSVYDVDGGFTKSI